MFWPSARLPGKTAAEKARHLLAATGVASVAGSAFFRPGHGEESAALLLRQKRPRAGRSLRRLRRL
jgi:aminotransferase